FAIRSFVALDETDVRPLENDVMRPRLPHERERQRHADPDLHAMEVRSLDRPQPIGRHDLELRRQTVAAPLGDEGRHEREADSSPRIADDELALITRLL